MINPAPAPEPVLPEMREIGSSWMKYDFIPSVHFDYNKADIRETDRKALKDSGSMLAALLDLGPDILVRVSGHCDERGSIEYNIALGERRAIAVRNYLLSFGLPKSRVTGVSFGEEEPLCHEQAEHCWSSNRRAEIELRRL